MTKLNFDSFEQDILDSVENDEWLSKGNIQERLIELQGFLKHATSTDIQFLLEQYVSYNYH